MDEEIKDKNLTEEVPVKKQKEKKSPVKVMTWLVLIISLIFFIWYILSDRHTPYTNQAKINGLMIPVTARVSGDVTKIYVRLHSKVEIGDTLFQLDKRPFELAVEKAEAEVDNTAQSVAAKTASVKSSAGRLGVSKAQLDGAQRNWERVKKVMQENPGALSQADRDLAETSYSQAVEHVVSAEADLERAQQALGISGESNPQFIYALKALEQARLDLAFSTVTATAEGYIESFSIDLGFYAGAGQPLATLASENDFWIQADMKENNLSLMKSGDKVEFALDVCPGKIFQGEVRSIGHGVTTGNTNRGDLPEISGTYGWLRDPQRFPVIISFNKKEIEGMLRLGGQVDVVVFTREKGGLLDLLGQLRLRIISWLSYVR